MVELTADASKSTLTIETRAKGMLAKLAHDLSIVAKSFSASVRIDEKKIKASLRARVDKLDIDGVRKGSTVDRSVLSSSDKADIHKKIREDVLKGPEVVVELQATLATDNLMDGTHELAASGTIDIHGKSARVSTRAMVEVAQKRAVATGRVPINLPALGITPPKGPLGAFRVDDDVDANFRLEFVLP